MMTPLLFNLKNKKVLVVGGGTVATRRVVTLLESGAQVLCVSPVFSVWLQKAQDIKNELTLIFGIYKPNYLEDVDLAVAATNQEIINDQIKLDCQARRIWCNRVDNPEDSDFIFPSVIRRGDLTLSVCTEGASPFLTKAIMDDLSQRYDESYTERTALLRECRKKILENKNQKSASRQSLKELARYSIEELKEYLTKDERVL
ncbi:precorrin-2 dehydrogenase/sirohydrochlorin ferrochelatase family protein [Acetobacterium bakii]|uniref:precorrin-2 dehydrogenase n=1 Tax=Acetobacterium bakii TaxID=52689 RepID=A0A0L6TXV4_9FIRM|nr:bifunctional precorrin-2 dehydrogenase/sirohydrochlorin ferrochelatase [Acetobacterium bakii]KNZ41096.1 hypothetical protein AKG39_13505 [Acetobacterium bakii]